MEIINTGEAAMTFHEIIQTMINQFGLNIFSDSGRFKAIFFDLAPKMEKEKKIIRRISEENRLSRFLDINNCKEADRKHRLVALFNELVNDVGLSEEWARYAVKEFAIALGWNTDNLDALIKPVKIDLTDNKTNHADESKKKNQTLSVKTNNNDSEKQQNTPSNKPNPIPKPPVTPPNPPKKKTLPIIIIIVLILSCIGVAGYKFFIGSKSGSGNKVEASGYFGTDLNRTIAEFKGMSEPTWAMGTTYSHNDDIYFGNSGTEENGVTSISIGGKNNPYSLFGISTDMSVNDIKKELESQGFVSKATDCYYKKDGNFQYNLSININGGELGLTAERIKFGPHTDKVEVSDLMGLTISEAMEKIDGLSTRLEDDRVQLYVYGLLLYAKLDPDDIDSSKIYFVEVDNWDTDYCIYGLSVGDSWDTALQLGLGMGGSGEIVDSFGNTIVMIYANDSPPRVFMTREYSMQIFD